MSQLRVRKIEYIVHLEKLDGDGNVIDELNTQQPLTLWAHQLAMLPDEVKLVLEKVEQQQGEQPSGA